MTSFCFEKIFAVGIISSIGFLKRYFLPVVFCFCALTGLNIQAQQNKKDSLLTILNSSAADTAKINVLHQLYLINDSVHYSFRELKLSEKINFNKGIAQSLLDIGRYYYFAGQEDISLDYLIKSVKIAEKLGEKKILCSAYRYIGFIYRPHDSFTAEDYYKKSLKMAEETHDEISEAYVLSAMGNIYEGIFEGKSDNNKKALEYYLRSLAIREKKGSNSEIASSLNETSRIYDLMGSYDKGLELRLRGLEIAEKSGSAENVVYLCNVLGNDYSLRKHDFKKGLSYQLKAYSIGKAQKNNFEIMFDITKGIGYTYYVLGEYKKSDEFYQQAVIINDSIKGKANRSDYNLSGLKHGLEKELEKQKLLLKDSEILKEKAESGKQTTLRNAFFIGFAFLTVLVVLVFRGSRQKHRSNRELDLRNKKVSIAYQTLAASENKFKLIAETINDVFYLYNIEEKKYEYISPNSAELMGAEPQFFYDGNSMKTFVLEEDLPMLYDANEKVDSGSGYDIEYRVLINGEIKWIAEKSSPIFDDKGKLIRNSGICRDITKRKTNEEIIQKRNKDITDSISYARTIQNAILVPKEEIQERLKDFFILSKPKDIVSGDFYFYKETKNGVVVAVADCTGHGVPAGFMSMIGNAFLNEIVNANETITPAEILDQLREMIIKSLNQNSSDSLSKDGMDIALLRFENNFSSVQYAGAFNPLYIIRGNELKEIKADMFPIGIHIGGNLVPFINNKTELQKGDSLFIFSDGYADQFGGANARKMMKKKMKEILLSVQHQKMEDQEKILNQKFNEWKGELEQIDDVLVIGIRIGQDQKWP